MHAFFSRQGAGSFARASFALPLLASLAVTGCASTDDDATSNAVTEAAAPAEEFPAPRRRADSVNPRAEMRQRVARAPAEEAGLCPVRVEGTSVTATDIDDGAALDFTTTGNVGELRERVAAMADMHNAHHAALRERERWWSGNGDAPRSRHPRYGRRGDQMGGRMMMTSRVPSTASYESTERGARITFVADDPAEVVTLRSHIQARAARMDAGGCPMQRLGALPRENRED